MFDLINLADSTIGDFFLKNRSTLGNDFFTKITLLANPTNVIAIILLTILLFIVLRKKSLILPLIILTATDSLIVYLLKIFVHRTRPDEQFALAVEKTFSFPSAHASMAIALFGFITYLVFKSVKTKSQKTLSLVGGLILIFLIGISRLYLGVHYLSDVVAGYIIGGTLLFITIYFMEKTKIFYQKGK